MMSFKIPVTHLSWLIPEDSGFQTFETSFPMAPFDQEQGSRDNINQVPQASLCLDWNLNPSCSSSAAVTEL